MKSKEQLLVDVYELAKKTVPMPEILDFSLEMGMKLADIYSADKEIIKIAMALMDLKIKDAKEKGDISLHTSLAVEFTKDYIKDYDLSDEEIDKIINCIEAHHGAVPYKYIEAEIVANADCYIFIHPKGVFAYKSLLEKRGIAFSEQFKQLNFKLQEKYKLLSLEEVKNELDKYYLIFADLYEIILGKEK